MAQARRLTEPSAAADAITALLTISLKRSFLAESATTVILDIFDQMPHSTTVEVSSMLSEGRYVNNCLEYRIAT